MQITRTKTIERKWEIRDNECDSGLTVDSDGELVFIRQGKSTIVLSIDDCPVVASVLVEAYEAEKRDAE